MFLSKLRDPRSGAMTVIVDSNTYTVDRSHPNYELLYDAYKENDSESFVDNYDIVQTVANIVSSVDQLDGVITFDGDRILYDNLPIDKFLSDTILAMKEDGEDLNPMFNFLHNLMQNPSSNSVEQLYKFLAHKQMPITEDGCFIAYKTVKVYSGITGFTDVHGKVVNEGDFVDKYSGTVRNNVGDVISMPRNKVDDNKNNHCSHGYHVGTLAYAGPDGWYNSGDHPVILVKVNPKDAVSVPTDHSFTKLRVCEYEVVDIFKKALNHSVYKDANEDYYANKFSNEDEFEDDQCENCEEYDCDGYCDEADEEDYYVDVEKEVKEKQQNGTFGSQVNVLKPGMEVYIYFEDGDQDNNGYYYVEDTNGNTVELENIDTSDFDTFDTDDIYAAYWKI